MNKYKYLLLISGLGILLFRLFSIAPFDPPDEQSHYAQTHFYITEGRMPNLSDKANLSEEEIFAERIIGTMSEGENKYFFHPEYRYELVNGYLGKYEDLLRSYNTPESRSTYATFQSSTYPPLYYWVASLFYRLVYGNDFMTRLYALRFSSLVFTFLIPIVAYYFALTIWGKSLISRTLSFMVFFFPMTSYLGVGINSDNLHFLLVGIAMLLLIRLIKYGFNNELSMAIGVTIGLDLITKPQAYALFPIFVIAVLIRFRFDEWKLWFSQAPLIVIPILLIAGWQEIPKFILGSDKVSSTAYIARSINYGGWDNFILFGKDYLRTHLTEVIVWYWGVFKWSGIILPRFFWWVANRLLLVAALGIFLRVYRDIKAKSFGYISKVMLFSIFSNLIYVFAIFMFDWQFYQEYGHSLGLQGRYYLPLLITQMFLLLSGLTGFSMSKKIQRLICYSIILFFLSMHIASVYVQIKSYYDLYPITTFIDQVSQYKPALGKGNWWYLWVPLYFAGIITTTYITLKGVQKK